MEHKPNLSIQEKFNIWLDLCDFSYKLMKQNLPRKELQRRLYKLRKEHLDTDIKILKKIFKYDKKTY